MNVPKIMNTICEKKKKRKNVLFAEHSHHPCPQNNSGYKKMRALCKQLSLTRMHMHMLRSLCCRWLSGNSVDHPKVAVVGSGPAGFYTAQQLIKVNLAVVLWCLCVCVCVCVVCV